MERKRKRLEQESSLEVSMDIDARVWLMKRNLRAEKKAKDLIMDEIIQAYWDTKIPTDLRSL